MQGGWGQIGLGETSGMQGGGGWIGLGEKNPIDEL